MTPRQIVNNIVWFFKKISWPFISFLFLFRKKKLVELPFCMSEDELSERTRYVDKDIVVIEVPPCKRVVHTDDGYHQLSFPFIYFIIRYTKSYPDRYSSYYVYSSLRLAFSGQQLKTSNELVGKIPISNYYESCAERKFNYCLGDGAPRTVFNTLKELSDTVVANFWQTSFQMNVDKQWMRDSKRKRNHSSFIESMINQKTLIKTLMDQKNVNFHQYVRPGPIQCDLPQINPSGTSVDGYKKRIRKRHKKQSADRET